MERDLTDTWHGRFAYPAHAEPVGFVAQITQTGEWLSGAIEEPDTMGLLGGKLLRATISGRSTAGAVMFLKLYDVELPHFDGAIHYEGVVGDGGLEISGAWSIPDVWSGTFIMIRSQGLPQATSARETEEI